MKNLTELLVTLAIILSLGSGVKKAHDFIRTETLKTISKGFSSSEKLANALTGEKLNY